MVGPTSTAAGKDGEQSLSKLFHRSPQSPLFFQVTNGTAPVIKAADMVRWPFQSQRLTR